MNLRSDPAIPEMGLGVRGLGFKGLGFRVFNSLANEWSTKSLLRWCRVVCMNSTCAVWALAFATWVIEVLFRVDLGCLLRRTLSILPTFTV